MTVIAMPDGSIVVELVESNFLTRWLRTFCGGHTEKDPILETTGR
jgi:hypothetical protein